MNLVLSPPILGFVVGTRAALAFGLGLLLADRIPESRRRNPLAQQFNVSPTALIPMLRPRDSGGAELVAARWGLIPFWWKQANPPRNTFNARSEEALTKPMWRIPASKARCLVPAMGWYEWKEIERADPAIWMARWASALPSAPCRERSVGRCRRECHQDAGRCDQGRAGMPGIAFA